MTEHKLNLDLFRAIRDKIATTPEAYDQSVFARQSYTAPCGTRACIAGWACVLSGEMDTTELMRRESTTGAEYDSIALTAKDVLGLEQEEADVLFTEAPEGERDAYGEEAEGGWPEPFCYEWDDGSREDRAMTAIAYLNHIIETGQVTE